MSKFLRALFACIWVSSLLVQPSQTSAAQTTINQQILAKIDPWVMETSVSGETEVLVLLNEQADLSGAAALRTKLAKGQYVYKTLTQTAKRTQSALLKTLADSGAVYQSYWVANMVWVKANRALITALAQRSDVAHLYANPTVKGDLGQDSPGQDSQTDPLIQAVETAQAVEWNISLVKAPQVWNAGFQGQGVVIGGQDTGYDWNHPALHSQYRGTNGASVDHNYNWYDAIHAVDPHNSGTNPCGLDTTAPCDDYGHGTHTMGTMVGDDGGTKKIGMAPQARWIGCRNMERGWGKPSTYAACYQWFIAPTTLDPNNPQPDPAKAPDIINNSWGCPTSEGCTDPNVLLSVVNSVTAAGILTVHSAGNEGRLGSDSKLVCGTIQSPAAIYAESFTVGNTDEFDTLNSSSSIGPINIDGSGRMKPNVSAPGTRINSSVPGTGYTLMTGTSMAGPHVVGLAALLLSARPDLAGQVNELRWIIERSASPAVKTAGLPTSCGGSSPSEIPNNFFGWGRIDAEKTVQTALTAFKLEANKTTVTPGEQITLTLTVTNAHPLTALTNLSMDAYLATQWTGVKSSQPFIQSGSSVAWNLGQLDPKATTQITLSGYAGLCTSSTNNLTALLSSSETPSLPAAGPLVRFAGLVLNYHGPTQAVAGDTIIYTFGVTNTQIEPLASSVTLSSTLPAGLQFIQASPAFSSTNPSILWQIPPMASGAAWHGQITAKITNEAANPLINQLNTLTLAGFPTCTDQPVSTAITWKNFLPVLTK